MSDAYGQQRVIRPRQRGESRGSNPDSSSRADDHISGDDAAAYALGALEPDEQNLVAFHVQFCPRCAALVDRELRTAGWLAMAAADAVAAPAPDVKAALFARVSHIQRADLNPPRMITREQTLPASSAMFAPPAAVAAPAPMVPPAAVVASPKRRLGNWIGAAVSVPLVAALAVVGVWGMQLQDQVSKQTAQVNALQAQVANFGAGSRTMQLSPGDAMPQAEGKLVMGADDRSGMLQVDLNSDTAAGAYTLMGMDENGQLVKLSDLQVGQDGTGQAQFSVSQPFSSYQTIEIQPKTATGADDNQAVVLTNSYQGLGSTGSQLDALP